MNTKIIFGQAKSKAELRAEIDALKLGKSSAPMASADDLKMYSNVPGATFRGTHTKASAPHAPRNKSVVRRTENDRYSRERITVVTDHCGREFYRNEAGEWL